MSTRLFRSRCCLDVVGPLDVVRRDRCCLALGRRERLQQRVVDLRVDCRVDCFCSRSSRDARPRHLFVHRCLGRMFSAAVRSVERRRGLAFALVVTTAVVGRVGASGGGSSVLSICESTETSTGLAAAPLATASGLDIGVSSNEVSDGVASSPSSAESTRAAVTAADGLLVGASGAGSSGLSMRASSEASTGLVVVGKAHGPYLPGSRPASVTVSVAVSSSSLSLSSGSTTAVAVASTAGVCGRVTGGVSSASSTSCSSSSSSSVTCAGA